MKLFRSKIFLAFLFTILILSGCRKTIYNSLSDDDLKWLVYKQNDTIVFSSSASVVDTYIVNNRTGGYTVDKPHYNEGAALLFTKQNDTIGGIKNGYLRVSKDNDDKLSASFEFPHFPKSTLLTNMIPVPVDTINGLPYANVYISEADTNLNNSKNYIRKVYYTKQDGFLKLEDMFGNLWYKTN